MTNQYREFKVKARLFTIINIYNTGLRDLWINLNNPKDYLNACVMVCRDLKAFNDYHTFDIGIDALISPSTTIDGYC